MKRKVLAPLSVSKKTKTLPKKKLNRPSYKSPTVLSSFHRPTPSINGPSRLRTTFIYAENGISLNPGLAGVASTYVFNLNSLFDPNTTGAGHQPAGYDQMMAIYEEYIVYGVHYKIQLANSEAALEAVHGVTITDQITAVSDPRVYMENGQTQFQCVAGRGSDNLSQFSGYVDLAKIHGMSQTNYMEEYDYKGRQTTNPNASAYLHIWAAPMNATSDIGDQVAYVQLTYYAELSGGKLNQLS